MSRSTQIARITKAADELIRRIIAWLQDPHGGPVVPSAVITQLEIAAMVGRELGLACPDSCVPLQTAIWRLEEEYRGYAAREHGKVRLENGAPGPGFWAATKSVAATRIDADQPLVERLEPVSVLLKQGVSHAQIGQAIYGRRGIGPFLQSNGDVDVALIEREATSPGSVIPADWVPPWHDAAFDRRKAALQRQLALFSKMETAKRYDDPATVEELLQAGAFVQQVERAKGVSRADVLAAAERIGVAPVDGPGYRPGPEDEDDTDDEPGDADQQAVRDLIVEMYQKSSGQKGAAEIAAELRQAGWDIRTQAVSATIGHYRRKQTATTS